MWPNSVTSSPDASKIGFICSAVRDEREREEGERVRERREREGGRDREERRKGEQKGEEERRSSRK